MQIMSAQSTDERPAPVYADVGCTTLSSNNANISWPLDDDHVEYVVITQDSEDSHNDNDSGVQTGKLIIIIIIM